MKKILVMLFLSVVSISGAAAQFAGPSSSRQITTVEQALTARRGLDVTLKGFVVEHLRDRYYLFRDGTGEIRVKIDRHRWQNRKVTSKTPVQLTGRIDRDFREMYVNVSRLNVLK